MTRDTVRSRLTSPRSSTRDGLLCRVSNSGGGGNRTAGSSPDSDDSRTVSRTDIPEDTVKQHEQDALADVLMTMSQIPDVNRELAEAWSMHALFAAVKREVESS